MKKIFDKCKGKVKYLASSLAGVAVMTGGAVQAFAADNSSEAVSAAKSLMENATSTLNITNIVAILGAGIGAVIGLFLSWWGARKLVRMLMGAFKKGKVSL